MNSTHNKPLNKQTAGDILYTCPGEKCAYSRWDKPNREVYHKCNPHRKNLTQLKAS